jgi:hypothetical protein
MSKHHHNSGTHSVPRSALLQFLSILALLLPVVFYIISLSFALKTLYEPSFALSDVYDANNNPYPANGSYTYKSGPFYTCNDTLGGSQLTDVTQGFNQTCYRISTLGAASMSDCLESHSNDDLHFCQRSVMSAQLFVAGTVIIGIALLGSFVVLGLGFKAAIAKSSTYAYSTTSADEEEGEKRNHHHHHDNGGSPPPFTTIQGLAAFLGTSTTLLAVLAALLIAAGQMVGINAYVDTQLPSGIDSVPVLGGLSGVTQSAWYMGPGAIVWPSVAWFAAVWGIVIAASGCGVRGS